MIKFNRNGKCEEKEEEENELKGEMLMRAYLEWLGVGDTTELELGEQEGRL